MINMAVPLLSRLRVTTILHSDSGNLQLSVWIVHLPHLRKTAGSNIFPSSSGLRELPGLSIILLNSEGQHKWLAGEK